MKSRHWLAALALAAMPAMALATDYPGNGATGFGGPIGNGSLSVTQNGSNLTFTLNNAGGFSGNDLVVYIDSVPGGFADNSQFNDNGDGGRTAVSGANTGNPSRSLVTFPDGFGADYALEFENDTFDGLFGLVAGGNNSFNFVGGNGPSQAGGPYTVTVPSSDIGIGADGGTFGFVGTLISTTGYRSNETIGASVTIPDTGAAPNGGFNGTQIFAAENAFTLTAVPEPASIGLLGAGAMAMLARRRRA